MAESTIGIISELTTNAKVQVQMLKVPTSRKLRGWIVSLRKVVLYVYLYNINIWNRLSLIDGFWQTEDEVLSL